MIAVVNAKVPNSNIEQVVDLLKSASYRDTDISRGNEKVVIGAIGKPRFDKEFTASQI